MQFDFESAIGNRRVLTYTYDGHERIVIPAALGESARGNDVLRVFQVGGTSSSATLPAWELHRLDKMVGVGETGDSFESPPTGYRKGDRSMRSIRAQLDEDAL